MGMLRHVCAPFLFGTLGVGLLAPGPAVAAAEEPTIELSNGHRIRGEIVDTSDPERVTIRTGTGLLRLPRALIAHVEPTFAERRAALAADDYRGHLELARWLVSQDRDAEALELLKAVMDHPELDAAGMALIARLLDLAGEHEEALAWYRRYREAGGRDRRTLERLTQIEEIFADYERRVAERQERIEGIEVQEGVEASENWRVESPRWANPVTLERVAFAERAGDQVLVVHCEPGEKDKGIVGWREDINARGHALRLRIANQSERPLAVAIAVKAGEDWTYFESRPQGVPADGAFHTLDFDLTAAGFKCEKDQWVSFSHAVDEPERVREVQVLIHNGRQPATVLINDVGFLPVARDDQVTVEE